MTTEITIIADADDDAPQFAPYHIDSEVAEASGRSLSVLFHRRMCWQCLQSYEDTEVAALDPLDFLDLIVSHCCEQEDYLLPDTPMKEAIFRALLQNGNVEMPADEISDILTEKWAMTPFPRDTSPEVIQRLMDSDDYYCFAPAPQPEEPEEGDEELG